MLAWRTLEQPVRLQPPQGSRAAGRNNNNNNNARCSPREVESRSDGNLVLQQLLDLGRTPSEHEVFDIISVELDNWRRNPRGPTVVLSFLARHQLPRTANFVLTSMRMGSVEADAFHYNAAISACEKARQWDLALALLGKMPSMRVTPDEISYNAAISASSKGGQWQLVFRLLSSMPDMRLTPDKISYSAANGACEKGGQWQL
ncbi:unnamed protein product, partial [Polarella glacialis]